MTDAAEPQAERASLFSGRLEAARRSWLGKGVLFLVGMFALSAFSHVIGTWHQAAFTGPTARLITAPVYLLAGTPLFAAFVVSLFGQHSRSVLATSPWHWVPGVAIVMFVFVVLELWRLAISSTQDRVLIVILPAFAAALASEFTLTTLRARGWKRGVTTSAFVVVSGALLWVICLPFAFTLIDGFAENSAVEIAVRLTATFGVPAAVVAIAIPVEDAKARTDLYSSFAARPVTSSAFALAWLVASLGLWMNVSGDIRFLLYLVVLQAPALGLRHLRKSD